MTTAQQKNGISENPYKKCSNDVENRFRIWWIIITVRFRGTTGKKKVVNCHEHWLIDWLKMQIDQIHTTRVVKPKLISKSSAI